ncbi:unnamed protein product, partial [Eretmochelys imbricata]
AQGIREALKTLEGKVKDLEKHQTTILATPLPEDNMKRDLQRLREEIKDLAKDIRRRLKTQEGREDENRNAINNRMKRTQHWHPVPAVPGADQQVATPSSHSTGTATWSESTASCRSPVVAWCRTKSWSRCWRAARRRCLSLT